MNTLARSKTSVLAALAIAGLLAGCSSADPGAAPEGTTTTSGGDAPAASGACPGLSDQELGSYSLALQVLVQLRGQPQVDTVKDGTLPYDPDAFSATLDAMESLRGHPADGFGDPGDAIDFYRGANDLAVEILAIDGPVPQEKFDEIVEYEGEVGAFLSKQVALSVAIDEACG